MKNFDKTSIPICNLLCEPEEKSHTFDSVVKIKTSSDRFQINFKQWIFISVKSAGNSSFLSWRL